MKKNIEPVKLLGLLECPLRKGYIEFEYEDGDTIAELKKKVSEVWGTPETNARVFEDTGIWVILCEDETGAHLPLINDDAIPISPPRSSKQIYKPRIGPNPNKHYSLPGGVIFIRDVLKAATYGNKYDDKAFDRSMMLERKYEQPDFHLELGLVREYGVPTNRSYSVKLLALAVITGG